MSIDMRAVNLAEAERIAEEERLRAIEKAAQNYMDWIASGDGSETGERLYEELREALEKS